MDDSFENQHSCSSHNYTKKTYTKGYKGKRGTDYKFSKPCTEHDAYVTKGFKKNSDPESKYNDDGSHNMVNRMVLLCLHLFLVQFLS